MNKNRHTKFMTVGQNKLHLMFLQLKINSAKSVGEY